MKVITILLRSVVSRKSKQCSNQNKIVVTLKTLNMNKTYYRNKNVNELSLPVACCHVSCACVVFAWSLSSIVSAFARLAYSSSAPAFHGLGFLYWLLRRYGDVPGCHGSFCGSGGGGCVYFRPSAGNGKLLFLYGLYGVYYGRHDRLVPLRHPQPGRLSPEAKRYVLLLPCFYEN